MTTLRFNVLTFTTSYRVGRVHHVVVVVEAEGVLLVNICRIFVLISEGQDTHGSKAVRKNRE